MPNLCYNKAMKRVAIHLADRQVKGLKKLAARTGLPMAELIRRAVDEYLRREFPHDSHPHSALPASQD